MKNLHNILKIFVISLQFSRKEKTRNVRKRFHLLKNLKNKNVRVKNKIRFI